MNTKPAIVKLREFVDKLHGDRTRPAGIFGPSSLVEVQTVELKTAFAKADRIVNATIEVHRHHPVPMECRAIIASWDASAEQLTIHASTQSPHMNAHVSVRTRCS